MQIFAIFPRGTQRTAENLLRIFSKTRATTARDHCTHFAVDARVCRAKIAPNRKQNRAIVDRNHRESAPKMRANARKAHSKTALMPHILSSISKPPPACVAHLQRASRMQKLCKNRRERVRFSRKFFCFFRAERIARSNLRFKSNHSDA